MKALMTWLFDRRLSNFDMLAIVSMISLFDVYQWYVLIGIFPAAIVAMLGERKLEKLKERSK